MHEPDRGIWWFVEPRDERLAISHGPTLDGEPLAPAATILVSLPAALELAVGIVQAALVVDERATQALMLEAWVREQ